MCLAKEDYSINLIGYSQKQNIFSLYDLHVIRNAFRLCSFHLANSALCASASLENYSPMKFVKSLKYKRETLLSNLLDISLSFCFTI